MPNVVKPARKLVVEARHQIAQGPLLVIKIGSALLADPQQGLSKQRIRRWCAQIVRWRETGKQILLVSSGAVAAGVHRLGWRDRPASVPALQAAAAVGQTQLMLSYQEAFDTFEVSTAQVLLTHEDLADRQRYLNARSTLQQLLALGVVPVVNENDTVATDEIRLGDNDTLAAQVTNLINADSLIVLTSAGGLHQQDPRAVPNAPIVEAANANDEALDAMVQADPGAMGRGGMKTKLQAARLAARSGAHTLIANGEDDDVLPDIFAAKATGTLLLSHLMVEPGNKAGQKQGQDKSIAPLDARKRWLADQQKAKGQLQVDDGAAQALLTRGVSLLPVGATSVQGDFVRGDLVQCVDSSGKVLAQGLANYAAPEVKLILGANSEEIESVLGYLAEPELIHRDNLVILESKV